MSKYALSIAAAFLIATPALAESFTVVEHADTDATAPVGKAKDNAGDILTFANPVFDAAGGCLGMSTFGPRGRVIVIPHATLARVVPQLIKDGHVARGWLGVALHAVAVPDALRESADQTGGMMVMSVVENGPAAQAGIVAGDIILSVDGISANRFRKLARYFGSDSIGRKADVRLIRGGAVVTVQTTIAERQSA